MVLMHFHARSRPITLPLVGFGLLVPLVTMIFLIH